VTRDALSGHRGPRRLAAVPRRWTVRASCASAASLHRAAGPHEPHRHRLQCLTRHRTCVSAATPRRATGPREPPRVGPNISSGRRTSRLASHPCELVRLRPRHRGGRASQPSPPVSASVEVAPVLDLPPVHALATPPSGLLLFVCLQEVSIPLGLPILLVSTTR
jgi:hypothetical protein